MIIAEIKYCHQSISYIYLSKSPFNASATIISEADTIIITYADFFLSGFFLVHTLAPITAMAARRTIGIEMCMMSAR